MVFINSIYTIAKVNNYYDEKKLNCRNFFDLIEIEGLSNYELREVAYETGFMKRAAKKIDAPDFLALMCLESQKGSPSYNDLASRFETVYKISPTKQAVSKKVNQSCVDFFQVVLSQIIKSKIAKFGTEAIPTAGNYGRIIVQDSTIIKLPLGLFEIFSGVSNAHTAVCNARIQGVYDLLAGNFILFSIDPYSKNDLSAASELELQRGDLILRDRRYSKTEEAKRQIDAGADFITRHKYKTTYFDPISGEAIDLNRLLKKKKNIDMEILLNDKQTRVRLIAAPVGEDVANQRKRKAKKEMKGHNPCSGLFYQMGWTIFLTTIPKEEAEFQKILLIYGLRWRIEIIFKIWKSHMQFDKVHKVSENQFRTLLTARFIMIAVCTHHIYHSFYQRIHKIYKRELSMMKLFKYLMKNPEKIIECFSKQSCEFSDGKLLLEALTRYCTYDKRRKRRNFHQTMEQALN